VGRRARFDKREKLITKTRSCAAVYGVGGSGGGVRMGGG